MSPKVVYLAAWKRARETGKRYRRPREVFIAIPLAGGDRRNGCFPTKSAKNKPVEVIGGTQD